MWTKEPRRGNSHIFQLLCHSQCRRRVTLSTAKKLMITTRSATKAAGATFPPVHGVRKQLDPALKPEHDKHAASQNKQKGPTSAKAKPKAVLKPRLPASQIARKKFIDKSIKLLNKPKPQINLPDLIRNSQSIKSLKNSKYKTLIFQFPNPGILNQETIYPHLCDILNPIL